MTERRGAFKKSQETVKNMEVNIYTKTIHSFLHSGSKNSGHNFFSWKIRFLFLNILASPFHGHKLSGGRKKGKEDEMCPKKWAPFQFPPHFLSAHHHHHLLLLFILLLDTHSHSQLPFNPLSLCILNLLLIISYPLLNLTNCNISLHVFLNVRFKNLMFPHHATGK